MNLDQYPDITPKNPGEAVTGIIHTVLETDVGGYDYYDMLLVDPLGNALGRVKMSKKTWHSNAFSEKSKYAVQSDPIVGLSVRLARSKQVNQHGHLYWNVDKGPSPQHPEPATATPMPAPPRHAPEPLAIPLAPTKAVATSTAPNNLSIIPAIDAAGDLADRFERYMDLTKKITEDPRLKKPSDEGRVIVNFDLNAACFAILKGGW